MDVPGWYVIQPKISFKSLNKSKAFLVFTRTCMWQTKEYLHDSTATSSETKF